MTGNTNVWELAKRCEAPVATIVHLLVKLGAWRNDAGVEDEIADTVCSLLSDPQHRIQRRPEPEPVTEARVAQALLDAGAVESPVSRSAIATMCGTTQDIIVPMLDRMAAAGLLQTDEENRVTIAPSDARTLTALANQQILLDDATT